MSFISFETYIKFNYNELKAYLDAISSHYEHVERLIKTMEPPEDTFNEIMIGSNSIVETNKLLTIKELRSFWFSFFNCELTLNQAKEIVDSVVIHKKRILKFPKPLTAGQITRSKLNIFTIEF